MCEKYLNVSAFNINCIVHFINSQYWINVLFFQSFVLKSTKFMKVIQVLKFIQNLILRKFGYLRQRYSVKHWITLHSLQSEVILIGLTTHIPKQSRLYGDKLSLIIS